LRGDVIANAFLAILFEAIYGLESVLFKDYSLGSIDSTNNEQIKRVVHSLLAGVISGLQLPIQTKRTDPILASIMASLAKEDLTVDSLGDSERYVSYYILST
jgi:hypothetical protein